MSIRVMIKRVLACGVFAAVVVGAEGQSSSLYVTDAQRPQVGVGVRPVIVGGAANGSGGVVVRGVSGSSGGNSGASSMYTGVLSRVRGIDGVGYTGGVNTGGGAGGSVDGGGEPGGSAVLSGVQGSGMMTQGRPLYVAPQRVNGLMINPELAASSYTSVVPPEPRRFAVHDLVTIIIREQSSASSEATLETERDLELEGAIEAFPHLNLGDLLAFKKLVASRRGADEPFPAVDLGGSSSFSGEGEYERTDSLTTRLTARIIDVKPNGTLTFEARTFIQNDDEELTISVTGTCRAEDVALDNSVLSTQVFDLRVVKGHEGEMRKASKKGFLTKLFETIFNF